MPAKNPDLHGNVPDEAAVALVIIDVINDLEFPGGDRLLRHALPMADRLAALKRRAKAAGVPVVYANDNFGRWKSDFRRILERCLQEGTRGRPLAQRLAPDEDDYFVLKPKHSAFFATTLLYAAALPERPDRHPDRPHRQQLRALHGGGRLHAGLSPRGARRVTDLDIASIARACQTPSRPGSRRARAVSTAATSTAWR